MKARHEITAEDLPESKDAYELACQAAGIGVWDWNVDTGEMHFCPLARRILDLPPEGPVTLDMVRTRTHEDDRARARQVLDRALDPRVRARESYKYRIHHRSAGEVRWVRAHGVASFTGDGATARACRYTGSIEDITEREHIQHALLESEARLRIALDAAQMAVWELDIDHDVVTTSPDLNRLYRFPEDARPTSADFRRTYAPGERERLEQEGAAAVARGESLLQTRVRHRFEDGSEPVFTLRASVAPQDASGRNRAIGVVFDVTEQVRQEERLQAAAAELRHRLKNMATLIGVIAGRTWPRDEVHAGFLGRLRAMSTATDLMFGRGNDAMTMAELVDHVLAPFPDNEHAFAVAGPHLRLADDVTSGLAMVLHELATNAVKHGALSTTEGRVRLVWTAGDDGAVTLDWTESGGPPVDPPSREGFGSLLLRRGALPPPHHVELDYAPAGLTARIHLAPGSATT